MRTFVVALLISGASMSSGCKNPPPSRPANASSQPANASSRPANAPTRVQARDPIADRTAVYGAVLERYCTSDVQRLVVDTNRYAGWSVDKHGSTQLGVAAGTKTNFASTPGGPMPKKLAPGLPLTWLSHEDWWAMTSWDAPDPEASRWDQFRSSFPGSAGYLRLSDVGFSKDGSEALVHVWTLSTTRNSVGHFFALRRRGSGWSVVGMYLFKTVHVIRFG